MAFKFPDLDGASDYSIVTGGTIPPDELTEYPLGTGTDGVAKVLIVNRAANAEYKANPFAFLAKISDGQIADIPLSEV